MFICLPYVASMIENISAIWYSISKTLGITWYKYIFIWPSLPHVSITSWPIVAVLPPPALGIRSSCGNCSGTGPANCRWCRHFNSFMIFYCRAIRIINLTQLLWDTTFKATPKADWIFCSSLLAAEIHRFTSMSRPRSPIPARISKGENGSQDSRFQWLSVWLLQQNMRLTEPCFLFKQKQSKTHWVSTLHCSQVNLWYLVWQRHSSQNKWCISFLWSYALLCQTGENCRNANSRAISMYRQQDISERSAALPKICKIN